MNFFLFHPRFSRSEKGGSVIPLSPPFLNQYSRFLFHQRFSERKGLFGYPPEPTFFKSL
jgi:hypothetical protein